ncbi:tyrosine-type recombinase/integrase [Sediminitomix flava]|uniref:Site-specific recombinase XerD n=1 Tax=Sediminitomix flava TaxID=379075 RepID=A0A315Z5A7_SEDFL|nr:site-specific integrase [Sediminitomix flava]PWJ38602.1 site-specific recombinase XerD [Sediminitomix flava]
MNDSLTTLNTNALTNELSPLQNSVAWYIEDVITLYHDYLVIQLSEGSEEYTSEIVRVNKDLLAKAKSNLKHFLLYLIEYQRGYIQDPVTSFNGYVNYLEVKVERGDFTQNRLYNFKAYHSSYRKYPELKGFIPWLTQQQIQRVSQDQSAQQLIKETPILSAFKAWLKTHSKLTRETKYPKDATDIVSKFLDWVRIKQNENFQITVLLVNEYLESKNHLKVSSLNKYLKWIKVFCQFYLENLEAETPYNERGQNFHRSSEEIKRILNLKPKQDDEESIVRIAIPENYIYKMLNEADEKQTLIIQLGLQMGLRASSMLHLTPSDINFEYNKVDLWLKGKNNKRTLPMPPTLSNLLEDYIKKHSIKSNDRILGFKGENSSSMSAHFSNFLKRIELKEVWKHGKHYPISLHSLRHTFAYNTIDKYGLLMTSKLLCHESVDVTEKYYLADKLSDTMQRVYEMSEDEIKKMKETW